MGTSIQILGIFAGIILSMEVIDSVNQPSKETNEKFLAFAYEVEYQTTGFVLKNNPTICAVEPTYDLESWQIERFMKQTKISSDEWEVKLKEGQRDAADFWEITYVEKLESDDNSDCDIAVTFKPKAEDERFEYGLFGVAEYDPIDDNYLIKIYYLLGKLCENRERVGNIVYYWYEPCFTDDIRISDDLALTIKHELGHAFGLGHYQADDDKVTAQWSKGSSLAPSIMVKFALENNFQLGQIRADDVKKVRELYGDNGFQSFIDDDSFSLFRAKVFFEKDLFAELIDYSDIHIKTNSNHEEALTYKGLALWELDKHDSAISLMDQVLDINSENQDALYTKGKWLSKSEKYDEALDMMDKVIEINPTHDKALSYKGLIFEKMEKYEDAATYYEKAYDENPFNTINLNRIAGLFWDIGDLEKALEVYNEAISIDPTYENAIYNKANLLFDMGSYEEALIWYDKFLELNPNDAQVLEYKNETLELLGRTDEIQNIEEKVKEEPQSIETTIPEWIRNNAKWWVEGTIGDSDFTTGIQFLIKEEIIKIPDTVSAGNSGSQEIPGWIKNNADWWAQGLISDEDFVKGIQYLVEQGIIKA